MPRISEAAMAMGTKVAHRSFTFAKRILHSPKKFRSRKFKFFERGSHSVQLDSSRSGGI